MTEEVITLNGKKYIELHPATRIVSNSIEESEEIQKLKDKIKELENSHPIMAIILKRQKELIKEDLVEYELIYRRKEIKEIIIRVRTYLDSLKNKNHETKSK